MLNDHETQRIIKPETIGDRNELKPYERGLLTMKLYAHLNKRFKQEYQTACECMEILEMDEKYYRLRFINNLNFELLTK